MVNLPALILLAGISALAAFLFEDFWSKFFAVVLGVILGLLLGWLLWAYCVTKWRLWAFRFVPEEHWYELKEQAILNKLVWDDGSVFEQTELRSAKDKERIVQVKEHISATKQVEDLKLELATPDSLYIPHSVVQNVVELVSFSCVIGTSLLMVFTKLWFFIFIGFILLFRHWQKYPGIVQLIKKGDAMVIGHEAINIGYPLQENVFWKDVRELEFLSDNRQMVLHVRSVEGCRKVQVDLWRYKITDFRRFRRQVEIFANDWFLSKSVDVELR